MINGNTDIIAHIGYPTHSFKSPMIYNPYFEQAGINAVVVPMGCQTPDYPAFLKSVFTLTNIRGALITMPHKVVTVGLLDEVTPTVKVAGACNAVKRTEDGSLVGDMFDGAGFVRGVQRKGLNLTGARVLVVGSGGVGCAIAASLAGAGIGAISLFDVNTASAEGLGQRLKQHYPEIEVKTGSNDPAGFDLVVNATPMGMNEGDPLLGGQLLDALAHFSSPLNKANRAFQIAATSKYHLQFSHSKDTYSSSQGRMQVYEQTIKDATLSAWQDARYKDLRAWSQDETRVVWLP